jgi:hypothetical protein
VGNDRTRARTLRGAALAACLLAAATRLTLHADQPPATCTVAGTIASGRTPLPGVVVTATDADGRIVESTTTAIDGTYAMPLAPGPYTLRTEFAGFAPMTRDVTIDALNCGRRNDMALTLASRAAAAPPPTTPHASQTAPPAQAPPAARRGGAPHNPRPQTPGVINKIPVPPY